MFVKICTKWESEKWRNILCSVETKINLVRFDGKVYVRRPINKELSPK